MELPPWAEGNSKAQKGAKGNGIRYERKVNAYFSDLYGDCYVPGIWFRFTETTSVKARWCQPDGLLFDFYNHRIIIIEIKLKHTTDAWWQLRYLYQPVIRKVFGDSWRLDVCEVVRWYDGLQSFPEKVQMCNSILATDTGAFGVHICRP